MEYKVLTMEECWELLMEKVPDEHKKHIIKPTFPTRRWGQVTTKISTTDISSINKCCTILNSKGIKFKKRFCKETMLRLPKFGKFYKIEVLVP